MTSEIRRQKKKKQKITAVKYKPLGIVCGLTRHPVEVSFVSEFWMICNWCILMAAWSCKLLNFCEKFLRLFGKVTSYGKILLCESFHCDTD